MPDTFGLSRNPIARKEHRCIWCGGPIPIGEKHTLWVGRFDGEFQQNRFHAECLARFSEEVECGEGFTPFESEMPARVKALVEAKAANA